MPSVDAPAEWLTTGRARVTGASTRIRSAVRRRRAWVRARRRAVRIIHEDLGLRPGAGLADLVDAVARERGRPLTVLRLTLPTHVSGFCVQGDAEDTVVITAHTSERQGLHVLLHELYHLLSTGREADAYAVTACEPADPGAFAEQLPSLPPDVVHEVLARPAQARTGRAEDEEWAAEVFATVGLLLLSLDGAEGRTGDGAECPTGPLAASFGNRRVDI
ncbi:hypothetical protein [Streptomyces aureocirculatus]|uniref:hypothetical protein n=1 Tax=Streptomyces aureocirculatus TaxID=67275 RepID=UPI0004CC074D|nr:hypothetical protein [Streptomyces aureocirculatus]